MNTKHIHLERRLSIEELQLIHNFDIPVFPVDTDFALYENKIPVAAVPKPNGGRVVMAFDTYVPRPFSAYRFYAQAEEISQDVFYLKLESLAARRR